MRKPLAIWAIVVLGGSPLICLAQTPSAPFKSTCQNFGLQAQEPIGDREGHMVSISEYSCTAQGGPLEGAIGSGTNYWEVDKGAGISLIGQGIIRKPGMVVLYTVTSGNYSLTMADGKVTGFSGSAKGRYTTATGPAASLAGKAYTAKFRSGDRGQFIIETTLD